MTSDLGPIDRLLERADTLAGAWAARAGRSTTIGQERAQLRLFGVSGVDGNGLPLAGEVVDRYVAGGAGRLAGGIVLPFAVALLEYDLTPQALALEVASGTIDLGMEAELLHDAGRRAAAEAEASRLAGAALARIDANRTARAELLGVLGDAPLPWIGVPLADSSAEAGRAAVGDLVRRGADLVRIAVPQGRELAIRLDRAATASSAAVRGHGRAQAPGRAPAEPRDLTPSGSQRGIAMLRDAADEAAAERHRYVRLATVAPGLAAPEQAVVAAFERVDLVGADAVVEIVDGRIDPDRALADHSFAHRLYRRAGSQVVIGAGPLVVAPDLTRGVPSSPVTRAGRALALQVLGVALVRRERLSTDQVVAGALPEWLLNEPDPTQLSIAQAAVRRAVFADHPLAFAEPAREPGNAATIAAGQWGLAMLAALPFAGRTAFIVRDDQGTGGDPAITRGIARVAADIAASVDATALRGPALDLARGTVDAALQTIERLGDVGWRAILGERPAASERERIGADAVVERTESFDPFA